MLWTLGSNMTRTFMLVLVVTLSLPSANTAWINYNVCVMHEMALHGHVGYP